MEGHPVRSLPVHYAAALLAIGLAALVRAALTPVWGAYDRPFILFFPAVVFAAWYGRLGAAVVAIIVSAFVAQTFFAHAPLGFQTENLKQWTLILVFISVSLAIALLIEKMHRATTRAIHEAQQRILSEQALRESEQKVRAARDEALAANAAKDRFLAVLSHELRTPLNPILLLASEHARDASLSEEIRSTFQTIAENTAMEAQLIDDLLDISRIIHGKLILQRMPADVHTILRESLTLLSSEISTKRLAVHERLNAARSLALADCLRLKQAFTNLLRNAVRFTPVGGSIEVSSETSADGQSLDVTIADSGIGMTNDEIKRVFQAFVQGDHAASGPPGASGGLGLGLAIAKQVVELHGGLIWAESAGVGQGTRITLRLPLLPTDGDPLTPRLLQASEQNESTGAVK